MQTSVSENAKTKRKWFIQNRNS